MSTWGGSLTTAAQASDVTRDEVITPDEGRGGEGVLPSDILHRVSSQVTVA